MAIQEDGPGNSRGKWSSPGVPHKGWECVEVEDLGEPAQQCEMCESQQLRYVHHMSHAQYPDVLRVGCVCAGHMEGDLAESRRREASMVSRAAKRRRWTSRIWRASINGNQMLKADGYRTTVYPRGVGWAFTLAGEDGRVHHAQRNYSTQAAAKLAAFDRITQLLGTSA